MVKAKHSHYNVGEVKSKIIELILENAGPVAEPDIRKKMQIEYEGLTQATVNRHLNDLLTNGCLELIPPSKDTTRSNNWDISKLEKLVKIKDQYKLIPLNKYPKSLNVIIKEIDCNLDSPNGRLIKAQLRYSNSFFNMNLDKEILGLYSKSAEIYDFETKIYNFKNPMSDAQHYQNLIDEIYFKFIKNILMPSDVWIYIYDTYIKNSNLREDFKYSFKCLPSVEVSKNDFQIMIKSQLSFLDIENPEKLKVEEIHREIIKELSKLLSGNIFWNTLTDKGIDQLSPPMSQKIEKDLDKKISADIMKQILNDSQIYNKIIDLQKLEQVKRLSLSNTIFNYCVRTDIIENRFSNEEKNFVYGAQDASLNFVSDLKSDIESAIKKYSGFLEESLFQY
jgi:hypothetical protein